ncbi:unnamed protein product, partial [Rotaria magnacalcarata]
MKQFTTVTKLVHYTSKFTFDYDERYSKQYSTVRDRRLSSTMDLTDRVTYLKLDHSYPKHVKILKMHRSISSKFVTGNRRPRNRVSRLIDNRQFRLAPMWPEWNETDVNTESWDTGNVKKKDTTAVRNRIDIKTNVSTSPVVVDADLGIQSFDLVKPNQHLHHSEIMRRIISEITALWDICRKERYKNTNITSDNTNESNRIERTWRPWEHIYALNKVSKQSFITPYNPSGKYVVRLFF